MGILTLQLSLYRPFLLVFSYHIFLGLFFQVTQDLLRVTPFLLSIPPTFRQVLGCEVVVLLSVYSVPNGFLRYTHQ